MHFVPKLALILLIPTLLLGAGCATYHHDHYRGSRAADDAYRAGYHEGFDHGSADRRAGVNFNYEHDREFRYGISNNRYINDVFRDGYARGYKDGYYGRRY